MTTPISEERLKQLADSEVSGEELAELVRVYRLSRSAHAEALRFSSDYVKAAMPPALSGVLVAVRSNMQIIVDELNKRADDIDRGESTLTRDWPGANPDAPLPAGSGRK